MFLVDKTSSEGIAPEAFYILYTRCMQKRVKHAQPCPWQSVDKSHWSPQAIDNPAGISSHVPARRTQCIPAGIRKNRIYHGVQNTSQFHPVPNLRPTFAGTWPMLFGWWLVVRRWRTAVLSTQRFPWLWRWTHAFPFLALLLVHLLVLLPAFLLWLAARRCLLRQFFGLTVARAALLTAPVGTLCSSSGCLPRATTLVPSPRVTVDAPVPVLFLRTLGVDHILPTMWTPHVTAVFAFPLWLPLAWGTFQGCRPLVTHWTASSFSRRTTTPFSRRRSPTMSRRTPFSRRSSPTMSRRTSTPVSRRSSSALTRMPPPTSTRRFAWGSFVLPGWGRPALTDSDEESRLSSGSGSRTPAAVPAGRSSSTSTSSLLEDSESESELPMASQDLTYDKTIQRLYIYTMNEKMKYRCAKKKMPPQTETRVVQAHARQWCQSLSLEENTQPKSFTLYSPQTWKYTDNTNSRKTLPFFNHRAHVMFAECKTYIYI